MPESEECEKLIQQWAQQIASANSSECFFVEGGRTKPSLFASSKIDRDEDNLGSSGRNLTGLSMKSISGVIDYKPSEFTITAYAGTPICEINEILAQHGQYLPFDPPFFSIGDEGDQIEDESTAYRHELSKRTTLGGVVASGINGPGRWRYGGLRDFILETRFIDGTGSVRRGGRRVVKNAAGFDIPKLMVGSCGRLGVLVDVTLKVFPKPKDYLTLHFLSENLDVTLEILSTLGCGPWDIDAIETQLDGSVLVRLAGHVEALAKHGYRIQSKLSKHCSSFLTEIEQQQVWAAGADWLWGSPSHTLVKVPLTLRNVFELDEELGELEVERMYGSCGNVAWLRWATDQENPGSKMKRISKILKSQKLQGLVIQGPTENMLIGQPSMGSFYDRLSRIFDPHGRLGTF